MNPTASILLFVYSGCEVTRGTLVPRSSLTDNASFPCGFNLANGLEGKILGPTLSSGSHSVRVLVDAGGNVEESNESNNEWSQTIVV